MATPTESQRPERPANAIGALRLLFASLVIVAHSPEMLDGSLRREPLHMLFGGMSFGALAVDAFFLISGYLIAASFASSANPAAYFTKRILRIYPAFVVCSLLCVFIVAPLAGAELAALGPSAWARLGYRLVMLKAPEVEGAFKGLPYPALNGSAWTISYEFRCYILAALFGMAGLYRRPKIYAAFTTVVLLASLIAAWPGAPALGAPGWFQALFGDPQQDLRLLGAFMAGTCFWLYRGIPLHGRWAAVATPLLIGLMFTPLAETALVLLGGYILFWVAFKTRWKPLLTLNAKNDISYGIYLYAWPVGALLIWSWRSIPVSLLGLLTFAGAALLGAASWFLVEQPALKWKPLGRPPARRTESSANLAHPAAAPEPARPQA